MSKNSNSIVYASCTASGLNVLRRLIEEEFEISEIVTLPPKMAETNNVSGYFDFAQFAKSEQIPVYKPQSYSLDTSSDVEHFDNIETDLLIVYGWQRLIPSSILKKFDNGGLGAHGSAFGLPKGRGRSPMNWSLIEGLNRFVLSLITLTYPADSGKIVATQKFDITDFDDIQSLYFKLEIALERMLINAIPGYDIDLNSVQNQTGTPTYYAKRQPKDGVIDWRDPTERIYNLVRAVANPYPGAFTKFGDTKIYIWDAVPFTYDFVFEQKPGAILRVDPASSQFVVKTADGTLLIREWTAEKWSPEVDIVFDSVMNSSTESPHRLDKPENKQKLSKNS